MTQTADNSLLQIAIVGVGGRGINCFGALLQERDDAVIAAMVDPNSARIAGACEKLDVDCAAYPSIDALFEADSVDGVIITSPDHTHEEIAIRAIESGAHILVDKPLAITAAGCARVIDAAKAAQKEVGIGFNLRHVPLIAKIKELIDAGEIGQLMLIENREFYDGGRTYMARWNRRYEWSGGLWIHKGSHDFDVFNWWNSGGTPVRVSAFAGINALNEEGIPFKVEEGKPVGPNCNACAYKDICPDVMVMDSPIFNAETAVEDGYVKDLCIYTSDKDVHDNGVSIVEYDNGVRACHTECFVCNFTDRLYTIVGDRGTIVANLENPTEITVRPRWDKEHTVEVPPAEGGHGGSDPDLLRHFLECIRNNTPYSSTTQDGIRAVAVGEAAERSWRENRMVEIAELVDLSVYG